jgi:hypothetical protein
MTAIKTEKTMNSNNNEPTTQQRESSLNPAKNASFQFGLSIAIGVLTIVIAVAAFYFGIFPK